MGGLLDWFWENLLAPGSTWNWLPTPITRPTGDWFEKEVLGKVPEDVNDTVTADQVLRARQHAAVMLLAPIAVASAPAVYSLALGKKRLKDHEVRTGIALENAAANSATLVQTALASSVVAAAYTYILVQKLETGKIISKGLGDAVQTLLTVSAAGPAIQGIANLGSAFAKRGAK